MEADRHREALVFEDQFGAGVQAEIAGMGDVASCLVLTNPGAAQDSGGLDPVGLAAHRGEAPPKNACGPVPVVIGRGVAESAVGEELNCAAADAPERHAGLPARVADLAGGGVKPRPGLECHYQREDNAERPAKPVHRGPPGPEIAHRSARQLHCVQEVPDLRSRYSLHGNAVRSCGVEFLLRGR